MKILFDQGTPVPLRRSLTGHVVATAYEMGWATLANGELLAAAARAEFDCLVTTDQHIRHQQNLASTRLRIVVLPTTDWATIRRNADRVLAALDAARPGEAFHVTFDG